MRYLVVSFFMAFTAFGFLILPHFTVAEASDSASSKTVSIVEDHETKSFRFVIEGKEVARIDQEGLHVRDDVEYGGTISDVGPDHYDKEPVPPQGTAE